MFNSALLALVLISSMVVCAPAHAQTRDYTIGEGVELRSENLDSDRRIWISLPAGYHDRAPYHRYPVLYVLDGERHFAQIVGAVRSLTSDATPLAPEMIVVGIASQNRIADSTPTHSLVGADGLEDADWTHSGGAEAFLAFLERELIPYVEMEYAASDFRILSGYSLTGLASSHILLTRPDLFDAVIAADPSIWWDDFALLETAQQALNAPRFDHNQFFLTTTSQRYPAPYITVEAGGTELFSMLSDAAPQGLALHHHAFTRETHHSLPLLSLYEGLSTIFDGHMITLDELYERPQDISARFDQLSERLGAAISPPEGLMDYFASVFETGTLRDLDKALIYADINVDAYPSSSNAWATKARIHLARGEEGEANAAQSQASLLAQQQAEAAAQ